MAAVCGTAPRAGKMDGYLPSELIGQPARSPVPEGLRAAHVSQRARYAQASDGLPGYQDQEDIRGRMCAGRRREWRRRPGAAFVARITERD